MSKLIPVPWIITSFDTESSTRSFFLFHAKSFNPNLEQTNKRILTSFILPLFKSRSEALHFNGNALKYFNTSNIVLEYVKNNTPNSIKCTRGSKSYNKYINTDNDAILADSEDEMILQLALYNNVQFFYVVDYKIEDILLTMNGILINPIEYMEDKDIELFDNLFIKYLDDMFSLE